ncbi:glycosyltransferase family 10 domain-containing protein [Noviherbaspirillum autotrophicum]|uniref:Fucosyltransferase C-terminal domain-containing protein n=1 Tax=Noviherbaspirillum autotrophicum TaxID=709839 RepID=A0A0C1YU20_9BURK|nr:glycosyltransferase family 10 [Noviherbaspirillum autotrophicum]KIF82727.1 hypothetical protein TSA66_20885 [Noviherbaspirillum autotrophicum]KIF84177.1 hypothetical protein TSA66_00155 [Noviherbaspirillum autotrophicum]
MKHAFLRAGGLTKNLIFDLSNPNNRDNCFEPYVKLKEALATINYMIDTADTVCDQPVAFEIHQDVQLLSASPINYLLMFETHCIKPENYDPNNWNRYRKIFTWNDSLIDGVKFIKLDFPNPIMLPDVDGFAKRDNLCCMIAGNKAVNLWDERELYSERVRVIRWFEKNAPSDFRLYGTEWNMPAAAPGVIGRLSKKAWRYISRFVGLTPFPSYCGKVEHKREVLLRTRFAICYENVRDLPGYITEKIFDCFFSGCVPVYWGANNITDYIPKNCFIDRREFSDTAAVYEYINSMSEDTFRCYQQSIANFLNSSAAYRFSSQAFAETVVKTIEQDLGCA